jgi:hypothetical protein
MQYGLLCADPDSSRNAEEPSPGGDSPIELKRFSIHNEDRSQMKTMTMTSDSGPTGVLEVLLLALVVMILPVRGAILDVPNSSFESPATVFVDTRIDAWETMPKPDWYDESGGFLWSQLTGVFRNTPPESSNHIVNVDGDQAVYLFAIPGVGFFQDYDSTDWSNPTPTHAFEARFEPGKSYTLTIGVKGGGGNMLPGVTLEISLYYRDSAGERIPIATTSITHSPELFADSSRLIDFQTRVPVVQAEDPWANRYLGIQVLSTVHPDLVGGYWDLDHVRLEESGLPPRLAARKVDDRITLTLQSEPGLRFEILAAPDLVSSPLDWVNLGTITNDSGTATLDVF